VTSTKLRRHTKDPAPITIVGVGVSPDCVSRYSERAARKGRLGRIQHKNVIPILLDLMGITNERFVGVR
jgi:2,3-bisphosphoglycerate-independent phosphoglycerate mutase